MAQDYNRAIQSNSTKTLQQYPEQATAECAGWGDIGIHNYIKMMIIGSLFYYLFRREIYSVIHNWTTDPNWSHGFLIPLFSLYFINQRKQDILNGRFKPNYLGLLFLICGVLFYPLNVVQFRFGYLLSITMIATLGAVVLFLGGWRLVKHLWLPVGFLIFAVPLPPTFYVRLTMPMRFIAAKVTAVLLDFVPEVHTTVSGVVIDVIYKGKPVEPALNVAEACSGMRLLMAFVALGVAMAYLHYRPVWHRIVLLAATIPIAILCNIVRVTVTGFIYVLIDPIYAQGLYHSLLGFAMLPLAFGLYGFIAWFMSSLLVDETELTGDVIVRRR